MFDFSNVLAGSYRGGSLSFSGDSLLAGCGNRLWAKDLVAHSSYASSFETVEDLEHIMPLENEDFVIVIDRGGRMSFINCRLLTVLVTVHLRHRVTACAVDAKTRRCVVATRTNLSCWKLPCENTGWQFSRIREWLGHTQQTRMVRFSPDSQYIISCGNDNQVQFHSASGDPSFHPLMFVDPLSSVLAADFSEDMRHVVAVTESGHLYLWRWSSEAAPSDWPSKLRPIKAKVLGRVKARKEEVKVEVEAEKEVGRQKRSAAVLEDQSNLFPPVLTEGRWESLSSHRLAVVKGQFSNYTAADFHRSKRLMVLGTSTGELVTVQVNMETTAPTIADELARVLVVAGEGHVGNLKFNSDGEWIAAGLPTQGGTLCVWEWRSSTFILRETAIDPGLGGVTAVAVQSVSTDSGASKAGQLLGCSSHLVATGYGDGRVVVWDSVSGFELKRFSEHTGPVTSLCFTNQQHTLVSASATGEIKCYELIRMRCFRSISTPNSEVDQSDVKIPISGMSVDGSGSLVCAASGGSDCSLFLYSMQTGQLIETFTAGTSPVVDIQFNLYNIRHPGQLAVVCLDGNVCIWDLFERDAGNKIVLSASDGADGGERAAYANQSGGFSIAWNPMRHSEIAVALGGGDIVIWNLEEEEIIHRIDGSRDIDVGREKDQITVVKAKDFNRSFDKMAFAGPNRIVAVSSKSASAYVYDVVTCTLLYKWKITHNRTYENLARKLNAKQAVDVDFDLSDLDADEMERHEHRLIERDELPGVRNRFGVGDRLVLRKQFRVRDMALSFDAQNLVIGTSHGAYCFKGAAAELMERFAHSRQSLHHSLTTFSPVHLDDKTTQKRLQKAVQTSDLKTALKLALRINDYQVIAFVYERIDKELIESLARNLEAELVIVLIHFIKRCFELRRTTAKSDASKSLARSTSAGEEAELRCSILLEIHVLWLVNLLNWQKAQIHSTSSVRPLLLAILKDLLDTKRSLNGLLNDNRATADFIGSLLSRASA